MIRLIPLLITGTLKLINKPSLFFINLRVDFRLRNSVSEVHGLDTVRKPIQLSQVPGLCESCKSRRRLQQQLSRPLVGGVRNISCVLVFGFIVQRSFYMRGSVEVANSNIEIRM